MTNTEKRSSQLEPPGNETLDALLGDDLEIDDDAIEEILFSRGLDPEKAVADLKTAMQHRIRDYTDEGSHPDEIKSLQFLVRDITNYQRARSPATVEPKSWIKSILDNTNKTSFPSQLARAYRGKKEEMLTEGEDQIIRDMEDELADE